MMTWNPDRIDWLALNKGEYTQALAELLSSNPALNRTLIRPTLHGDLGALYRSAASVAQEELKFALDNAGYNKAFQSSGEVQEALVNGVTKYLMSEHYNFALRLPKPVPSRIFEMQIWFPATYYVVRRCLGKRFYRYLTFLGWEDGIPQRDFYGGEVQGSRHPAVVIQERTDGTFWMIPLSHSPRGALIDLGDNAKRRRFAQYNFPFVVSGAMLERDSNAHNVKRVRIRTADFSTIKQKSMRYIER